MCNEPVRIEPFIPLWLGKSVQELFSNLYVKPRFQYHNVFPRHCMICKRSLSDYDMWPPGLCPRSMCEDCYQNKIVGIINERCIISGSVLPKYKTDLQFSNPREVENNIADGLARDYYTLLACKVVGIDTSFVRDDTQTSLYLSSEDYRDNYDVIDADYQVVPQPQYRYLESFTHSYQQIPKNPSCLPVPAGKKIKFIPKIKKTW